MGDIKPPNVEKLKANKDIKVLIEPWIDKIQSIEEQVGRRAIPGIILSVLSVFIAILIFGVLGRFIDYNEDLYCCSLAILIPLFGLGLILIRFSKAHKEDEGQKLAKEIMETCQEKQLPVEMALKALTEQTRSVVTLEVLGNIGVPAVKLLITALNDTDTSTRSYAAEALGKIGDGRAVAPLIAALFTTEPTEQGSAVRALRKLAANTSLKQSLRDKARAAAEQNDQELKKLRTAAKAAIKPLTAKLLDMDSSVRIAAAEELDKIGWQPDKGADGASYWIAKKEWEQCIKIGAPAVKPLIARLNDPDRPTSTAAVGALRKIGAPAVLSLIATLNENNSSVRMTTAEALENIGWQPDKGTDGASYWIAKKAWDRCIIIGAPAVKPLLARLNDTNVTTRAAAARALIKIGAPAVKPLINALETSEPLVQSAVINVLQKLSTDTGLDQSLRDKAIYAVNNVSCSFAGKVVPVTKNIDKFVRNARLGNPIGLFVRIKDWTLIYGELLHRGGSSTPNPFTISPSASCHLICAQCNVEFDGAALAMLGPDSVMSAFGVAPVNRCRACDSPNVIIVSTRGR